MEEQIMALDPELTIYDRIDYDDEIHIYCEKIYTDRHIHQTTIKAVGDIPFNNKKVILYIKTKRFKNDFDTSINKKTITEKFDFLNDTGRRTKRLDQQLYDLTENQSFNASEEYAKKYICNISGNTLIRMVLKKTK